MGRLNPERVGVLGMTTGKYQECYVGTYMPLYFGFPEDNALALKHRRILYIIHNF
jgi:hypothetical protein